jgi:C4-dicarboxylate transporter DctQ subunit
VIQLLHTLRRVELVVTFAAFVVLATVIFADVVIRELTGTGLAWAREVGVYANVVVTLVGIGLASDAGAHLRPRFADRWLPAAWEPTLLRVGEILTTLFCLSFAYIALRVVLETRDLDERSVVLRMAVWPVQAVLPLAFVLAAVRHAAFARWPTLAPAPSSETST